MWIPILVCCSTALVLLLCVPLTTLLWTLSAHCLTWPPPSVSPSTARSWLSHHPQGERLSSIVCMCVSGHNLRGVEAPRSPGPGSSESHRVFLEGPRGSRAEPAGLRQAAWARAWPLADTKLVASTVFTSLSRGRPHLPSAHQVGTLQALSCTEKCFQLWLRLWCALKTSACTTLRNRILLIGCK